MSIALATASNTLEQNIADPEPSEFNCDSTMQERRTEGWRL
jgi:hypothetical protein